MGIRGELYTEQVKAENRTYFFNVKENSKGDVFLQVVESKQSEGAGFDRHAVVVFESEMRLFLQGLDKCIEFIEKNKSKRFKEMMKKREEKKSLQQYPKETSRSPKEKKSADNRNPYMAKGKKKIILKKKNV